MTRSEFIEKTKYYHGNVGGWSVVLDKYSSSDFILGCYYDKENRVWKVYKTDERGIGVIRLETASEETALDKLYSMIEFEYKMDLRYKELEAKRKK